MNTLCTACLLTLLTVHSGFCQTKLQIENVAAFTRLYGYVRYFHPSDEAAALDWDRFAIFGAGQVESCKTKEELAATLAALFHPIAPTVQVYAGNKPPSFRRELLNPADTAGYQVVSWQHQGVDVGNGFSIYKSIRTNRPTLQKITDPGSGSISKKIDAKPHRNKEFLYRARVKVQEVPGKGHLWIRVGNENKTWGFFDEMDDQPIKSKEWESYEIKGTVSPEASEFILGAYFLGAGELWLDDVTLLVKEGDSWETVYANSFEEEELGQTPTSMTPRAKSFLYKITPSADVSPQKVLSIKKSDLVSETPPMKLFSQYAKVGEFADKGLGAGLRALLPLALYGSAKNTYPVADKSKLIQLQKALAAVPAEEITSGNLYVRLADIAIAWNIFQHFYPYFEVAKTDWRQDLIQAIKSAYSDQSEADFKRTLLRLTAKLKDGHVFVSTQSVNDHYSPPISWEWVENKLVLTLVFDKSLPFAAGDIVTTINGKSPEKHFEEVYPLISAATPGNLNYHAPLRALQGEKGSSLTVRVKKEDKSTTELTLKRDWRNHQRSSSLPQPDSINELSPGIFYINISTASMWAIEKAMAQLEKSKAIICDLRGYPNNNHIFIENLLSRRDTSSQWTQVPYIIYPDQEKIVGYRKTGWKIHPREPHLKAHIIFIIDGRAISYAESYMSFIEHYKLATIVGQPTAGTNGAVNPFTLPSGSRILWTGMKVLKHDGSRHHGIGILPHVQVNKTIKGVRENRDEFLEKAIEIAKSTK